jgi:hypothetical protein
MKGVKIMAHKNSLEYRMQEKASALGSGYSDADILIYPQEEPVNDEFMQWTHFGRSSFWFGMLICIK